MIKTAMVDTLCIQMKTVSFAPNVETLCTSMKKMEVREPTFEENRVQYLINCMKRMPRVSPQIHKALEEDRRVLERRIKRERRKYSKITQKTVKMSSEPGHQREVQSKEEETEHKETENEEFSEIYEESFIENDDDHPFDIDNFNDE